MKRKLPADGLKSCVGFYKEIVSHLLDIAYLRYRYEVTTTKQRLLDGRTWKQRCEQDNSLFMDDLKQYQGSHKVL